MKYLSYMLAWCPLALGAAGGSDLPPLLPPHGEEQLTFWQEHRAAVLLTALVFILVQSWLLWKWLMRLQPKAEPPVNLARAALFKLLNEPEDGALLSEVTRVLRYYFGAVFGLPGESSSTAEFLVGLEREPRLDSALKQRVTALLQACDVRKFAPGPAGPEQEIVERAMALINDAEKCRSAQPEATA
ncbi:MAG TPA: hypothetical protein VF607_14380 [Verrucomicrobiae bacterium]